MYLNDGFQFVLSKEGVLETDRYFLAQRNSVTIDGKKQLDVRGLIEPRIVTKAEDLEIEMSQMNRIYRIVMVMRGKQAGEYDPLPQDIKAAAKILFTLINEKKNAA